KRASVPGIPAFGEQCKLGDKCREGERKQEPLQKQPPDFPINEEFFVSAPFDERETAAPGTWVLLVGLMRRFVPGKKEIGAKNASRRERGGRDDRIDVIKTSQVARNAGAD